MPTRAAGMAVLVCLASCTLAVVKGAPFSPLEEDHWLERDSLQVLPDSLTQVTQRYMYGTSIVGVVLSRII